MGAALLLFAASGFLALALLTYHQTDPSSSTAAGGVVLNWMGAPGAWVADMALLSFGPLAALLVPLLFVSGRRLWRLAGDGVADAPPPAWWRGLLLLLLAMVLLASVLALAPIGSGSSFPASMGGLSGLLGAKLLRLAAALLPPDLQFWAILGQGLLCTVLGAFLIGRVFAIDWAGLLAMPKGLPKDRVLAAAEMLPLPKLKKVRAEKLVAEAAAADEASARRTPEISEPGQTAKPAPAGVVTRQRDLFDTCTLPGLDLLADAPPQSAQKVDKLAL
ncbi:MAG: hypothetical protein RLZZ136_1111 [Pseudomonadota bacterium]